MRQIVGVGVRGIGNRQAERGGWSGATALHRGGALGGTDSGSHRPCPSSAGPSSDFGPGGQFPGTTLGAAVAMET